MKVMNEGRANGCRLASLQSFRVSVVKSVCGCFNLFFSCLFVFFLNCVGSVCGGFL